MSELIANADLKLKFTAVAVPPDAVYGGDIGIDGLAVFGQDGDSECPKGTKVQKALINYTFSAALPCPFTSALYTFVAGFGIVPAASQILTSNITVCKKGDNGPCVGLVPAGGWVLNANPAVLLPCRCTVEIEDAGQNDVEAE